MESVDNSVGDFRDEEKETDRSTTEDGPASFG
jgi:hypothetical protein